MIMITMIIITVIVVTKVGQVRIKDVYRGTSQGWRA